MITYQTCNTKFQKNSKKIQQIRKTLLRLLFEPKYVQEVREREKIKKIVPTSSYSTRNRKFQNNNKKIQKIRKHYYGFFSSQNMLGKAEKGRK